MLRSASSAPLPSDARSIRARRLFLLALIGLTLLGAAVRWHYLSYPMRYDEAWNYLHYSSQSRSFIATHYVPNNHVLHTLLVRCTVPLLGSSPAALRAPAFGAGVLLLPVSGWLAWVLFRRRAVVLLTLLATAGSSQLIEYSANSRGYSLQVLFALLAALVTVHLLEKPMRIGFWLSWGLLGALGAYTIPTMFYPMLGFAAVLLVGVLRWPRGTPERRRGTWGLIAGTGSCALLTAALYLPVIVVQGLPETLAAVRRLSLGVYEEYLNENGDMFAATWANWVRHSHVIWQILLAVGFAGFMLSAWRRPTRRNLVPLVTLVGLPVLVWLQGVPMTPPGWLFALPIFFACILHGLCVWAELVRPAAVRAVSLGAIVALAAISSAGVLANTARQPYLSTWDHELVDIERILDECERFGYERCALAVRYHPAAQYYIWQRDRGAPQPVEGEPTERLYVAVGTLRTLNELWHPGIPGYGQYEEPRVWRRFSRCTVYMAERHPDTVLLGSSAPSVNLR